MRRARLHMVVPLLAGVAVVVLTVQLGNWQVGRALEKGAMQAKYESAALSRTVPLGLAPPDEWQKVEARGVWHAAHAVLLDNRVHQGRAGYHVLMPLERAGGSGWVLVNRGWVAARPDRRELPVVGTPAGEVAVTGRVRRPPAEPFTLTAEAPTGPVWQVLDLERYRERSGLPVGDFVVLQAGGGEDGLVRDWPRPDAGVDRHRGYALQWYSLAALAGGLTGWYGFNGLRRRKGDHHDAARTGA